MSTKKSISCLIERTLLNFDDCDLRLKRLRAVRQSIPLLSHRLFSPSCSNDSLLARDMSDGVMYLRAREQGRKRWAWKGSSIRKSRKQTAKMKYNFHLYWNLASCQLPLPFHLALQF